MTQPASAIRPWVGYTIDRFGDTALVTIRWYWFDGDTLCRKMVEQYETLSRGATASAKKSASYIKANLIGATEHIAKAEGRA